MFGIREFRGANDDHSPSGLPPQSLVNDMPARVFQGE